MEFISKEHAIEILEAALVNPNYLASRKDNKNSTNWFCASVQHVLSEKFTCIVVYEYKQYICDTYIYPSINDSVFLKSYLVEIGVIPDTCYSDPVYKIAARNHWATLIESLKADA